MAQPIEPLAELVSWPLSCGPLPCLTLPSIPWCRPGRLPPELSSDRNSRSAFARVAFGTHRHAPVYLLAFLGPQDVTMAQRPGGPPHWRNARSLKTADRL